MVGRDVGRQSPLVGIQRSVDADRDRAVGVETQRAIQGGDRRRQLSSTQTGSALCGDRRRRAGPQRELPRRRPGLQFGGERGRIRPQLTGESLDALTGHRVRESKVPLLRDRIGHCGIVPSVADVALFHHAQGLTDGVRALADELRAGGHRVTTPDLYDGRTFDDLSSGVGYAQQVGFDTLIRRGGDAAAELPETTVYIGMSLGVLPAQSLAQTRAGARGAVLLHGAIDASEFGNHWPLDVPVQIHGMDADPEFVDSGDLDAARAIVNAAGDGELFLYPGGGHLFSDRSLDAYDEAATRLLLTRVIGFLDRVG